MKDFFIGAAFLAAFTWGACKQKAPTSTAISFANTTDFVCGMKVQADYTDTCHHQSKVYAFCSESCKEKFQANPESFLNKKTGY